MTRKELNQLEMFKTVNSLLLNDVERWNRIGPLTRVCLEFKANLEKLLDKAQIQETVGTTGLTAEKNARREELAELAYAVSVKVLAYAKLNRDEALKKEADYSFTDITKMSEDRFIIRCQAIYDTAVSNRNRLSEFDLDHSLIELNDALNRYRPLVSAKNNRGGLAQKSRIDLSESFTQTSQSLDTLDSMVEALATDAALKTEYEMARDRRGHGKKDSSADVVQ